MKLIDNIKNALGKRKVEKILKSKKRKVKVTNFENARSIGIVYKVSTVDYQDFINKYVDYLRSEIGFKKIVALGYCEGDSVPNFIYNQSMKYQFFTKKDLDFYKFGKSKDVNDFLKADFEILVDLTRDYITPIKHLVAVSNSGFKIGRHSVENEKFYDFMVEISDNVPVSQFISQVNNYLQQVKPK